MTINELADQFVESRRYNVRTKYGSGTFIDENAVIKLSEDLQSFIAEVIVTIIDAGSERDAVKENASLFEAILDELRGWDDSQVKEMNP
jgi:hypothetical protein